MQREERNRKHAHTIFLYIIEYFELSEISRIGCFISNIEWDKSGTCIRTIIKLTISISDTYNLFNLLLYVNKPLGSLSKLLPCKNLKMQMH